MVRNPFLALLSGPEAKIGTERGISGRISVLRSEMLDIFLIFATTIFTVVLSELVLSISFREADTSLYFYPLETFLTPNGWSQNVFQPPPPPFENFLLLQFLGLKTLFFQRPIASPLAEWNVKGKKGQCDSDSAFHQHEQRS